MSNKDPHPASIDNHDYDKSEFIVEGGPDRKKALDEMVKLNQEMGFYDVIKSQAAEIDQLTGDLKMRQHECGDLNRVNDELETENAHYKQVIGEVEKLLSESLHENATASDMYAMLPEALTKLKELEN